MTARKRTSTGLKDVARRAGVSIRTASRALRADGYVHKATRQKVLTAARALGYQPNLAARALRMGRSNEIAAVLGSLDELHIAKLTAFEHTVRAAGFGLLTLFIDNQDTPGALPDYLMRHRPAGVALFPGIGRARRASIHAQLLAAGIPDVYIDPGTDEPLDAVRIDRPRGVQDAIHHLAVTGRQRIAYLGPHESTRLDGYLAAMRELKRLPIHVAHSSERDGDLAPLFALTPLPDAIQVYSDVLAMRVLRLLHARGIRVPEDIAIIGFDNRDFASLASPPLTTVAQPNQAVGEAAADILLRKIRGESAPAKGWSRSLPTALVVRESTHSPVQQPKVSS